MRRLLLLVCFLVLTASAGDVQWRLSAENGLFIRESSESALLSRLSGRVLIRHRFSFARLQMQARLTPEWMNTPETLSTVKFSGKIQATGRLMRGNWRTFFLLNDYYYNRSETNPVFYKISRLGISYVHASGAGKTVDVSAEYAFRNWDTQPFNRTNLFRISSEFALTLPLHTKLGLSVTANHYEIHAQNRAGLHTGWQMGPGISFRHQNRFIMHYSLHYYRLFSSLSPTRQSTVFVRFLWGAFITKRLSAFVYVDYQRTRPVERTIPPEWRFTPFESENWSYLKLEYDVSAHFGLYGKGGYFKDILPDGNTIRSGVQFMAGLQLTK